VEPEDTALRTHNRIVCEAPRGLGDQLAVVVSVGGRQSPSSGHDVALFD